MALIDLGTMKNGDGGEGVSLKRGHPSSKAPQPPIAARRYAREQAGPFLEEGIGQTLVRCAYLFAVCFLLYLCMDPQLPRAKGCV